MKLSHVAELLKKNNLLTEVYGDADFNHISCDSRDVVAETLFFAKGVNFKKEFLDSAVQKGACCYITDKDYNVDLPYIKTSNIRLAMPLIARSFYDNPAGKYPLVGITGTKGKTSVAYMLKSILEEAYGDTQVGIISTNEALSGGRKIEKSATTPEALPLYNILNEFAHDKVKAAVMEVSSQGLQYNRVEYIDFDMGIFLNLSPDHVSPTEHKDFDEYKSAKKRMLTLCRRGIVNIDDKYSSEIIEAATCSELYTVSIEKPADFKAKDVLLTAKDSSFRVEGKYTNNAVFRLNMPGEFNIHNALAAIASACLLGIDISTIQRGLERTRISGRMEIFEKDGKTVIVDYAHNSLSLNALFDYVSTFYPMSKTICLFGCQGNKALGRRKELPEVAGKKASYLVLTSDDPANEDPEAILDEIENNLPKTEIDYARIVDREKAVKFAIEKANKGDVVILAGKGHEHTQQVGSQLIHYKGDIDCAKEALGLLDS